MQVLMCRLSLQPVGVCVSVVAICVCVCAKGINRVVNWQVACYVDYTSAARARIAKYPKIKLQAKKLLHLKMRKAVRRKSAGQERQNGCKWGNAKRLSPARFKPGSLA